MVSREDPYRLLPQYGMSVPIPTPIEAYNYAGRTQVNPAALTGTTKTFVCLGTSTSSNSVNATFTPTNTTKALNFSLGNGGLYQCVDPLLSCYDFNGNWMSDFADQMVTAGKANNCIVMPLGQSNAFIADWTGALFHRLAVAYKRLASVNLTPSAFLIQCGENDTGASTSQASYAASQATVLSGIRTAGFTCPIIISKTSWKSGATSSGIRAAQAAAVDNPNGIYAGPDTDTLDNTNRYDTTHFNATGRTAVAGLWKTSVISVLGL